jgi:hypothetical protein
MLLYTVFTSSVAYCQRVDIKTLVASSLSFVLTSLDYLGKIGGTFSYFYIAVYNLVILIPLIIYKLHF